MKQLYTRVSPGKIRVGRSTFYSAPWEPDIEAGLLADLEAWRAGISRRELAARRGLSESTITNLFRALRRKRAHGGQQVSLKRKMEAKQRGTHH